MGTTERLVVDLPSELVAVLRDAVRRGDFVSESEVVSVILRASQSGGDIDRDSEKIRALVAEGLAQAEAGEIIDADEVFDELEGRYLAMSPERDR